VATEIRHIVFDIGGVLIHWDPELAFIEAIPDREERHWFLENVCTAQWNIEQDRGRSWQDAEAELIKRFPRHEAWVRMYRSNWRAMVPYALDETVAVFNHLSAEGRDVTMLTNFASDTFAEALDRFDFLRSPRGVTVSGRVRLIKPQRAIYEEHARRFRLDPAATLFIDDSAANVAGATAAGWNAVRFRDTEALKVDLRAKGIEV
jgi:2-haloacid dehalogenase